ncbi:MAG: 3-phosphoshikimate 1-carboxyvinyltransferase [Bacteroidales bacterium]|nr:3-phosphoshikimate 1-carboxyvinyltransferase [Bacteroidales bacterium]
MYKIIRQNKNLIGKVTIPPSKSESNRALIIQALSKNLFKINNLSISSDTLVLEQALLKIKNHETSDEIIEIDIKDCGTAMRFLTAYLSIHKGKYLLKGTDELNKRPVNLLVDVINIAGGKINYINKIGFPPLLIEGVNDLKNNIRINADISSQFISALLLIAPTLKNGLSIKLENEITSKPYIDLTIEMLKYFGISVIEDNRTIFIPNQSYISKDIFIGGDWSSASFWFEIAILSDKVEIEIEGLNTKSIQADKVVIDIYKNLGIKTELIKKGIKLEKDNINSLNDLIFECSLLNSPDLFPSLAVTLSAINQKTLLKNLKNLEIKESKRLSVIIENLNNLGFYTYTINNDEFINKTINFTKINKTPFKEISTYKDHRIAMSFAPLATIFDYILLDEIDIVNKSYPNYWTDLRKFGFIIEKYINE